MDQNRIEQVQKEEVCPEEEMSCRLKLFTWLIIPRGRPQLPAFTDYLSFRTCRCFRSSAAQVSRPAPSVWEQNSQNVNSSENTKTSFWAQSPFGSLISDESFSGCRWKPGSHHVWKDPFQPAGLTWSSPEPGDTPTMHVSEVKEEARLHAGPREGTSHSTDLRGHEYRTRSWTALLLVLDVPWTLISDWRKQTNKITGVKGTNFGSLERKKIKTRLRKIIKSTKKYTKTLKHKHLIKKIFQIQTKTYKK